MAVLFGPGLGRQPVEGALLADTNAADQAPIVVQAVDSQAGNLMEFRDASGAVLSSVDITGAFGGAAGLAGAVILAPDTAGRNTVQPAADADAGLILKGHSATQSAAVLDVQTSAGASTLQVVHDKIGAFSAPPVVQQVGASAAAIAGITDANAKAAVSALQTALANLGWVTSPA